MRTAVSTLDVLFAQQPILDADQRVAAYELLFRGDFGATSGEEATATVLCNALAQGRFAEGGDCPLFLNFTAELLADPPPLDRGSFVIELLESIEPTATVIAQVRALRDAGYRIALDDFVYSEAMHPLLGLADVVKVEVLGASRPRLAALVAQLAPFNLSLLAEKVETHEEFELCRELGFELFQGFFFARPKLVEGHRLGPSKAAVLALVAALQEPGLGPTGLEAAVLGDSGLTFKVLQLVNSVENRRAAEIKTVKHAINMLGVDKIRVFATLLALSGLNDKPAQLQRYAETRTHLCMVLGMLIQTTTPADVFQTAGMLSCCPGYFDLSMPEVLQSLRISDEVKAALLDHSGVIGLVLHTAAALQEGRFDDVQWSALAPLGLHEETAQREINDALHSLWPQEH